MFSLLQAARFIAAALVLGRHAALVFGLRQYYDYHPLHGTFNGGNLGVDFFFVLSGFIICHAHWNDIGRPEKFVSYFRRRMQRIYPPYWVAALIILLPLYFVRSSFSDLIFHPSYLIGTFLLLPIESNFVQVAWTLQHEVMFYAVFGVLVWNRTAGMIALGVWFLASATISGAAAPSADVLDPRHIQFLLGMAAAFVIRHHTILRPGWLLTLGCLGFGACVYVGGIGYGDLAVPGAPNLTLTAGLACAMIVCALVELERSCSWRAPMWLRYLGDASYSLYLVHFPALTAYIRLVHARHLEAVIPIQMLFGVGIIFGLISGVLFYILVERSIQSLLKRRTSLARTADAEPASL